jgi:hypothetical protein
MATWPRERGGSGAAVATATANGGAGAWSRGRRRRGLGRRAYQWQGAPTGGLSPARGGQRTELGCWHRRRLHACAVATTGPVCQRRREARPAAAAQRRNEECRRVRWSRKERRRKLCLADHGDGVRAA